MQPVMCGSWQSSITAESIAAGEIQFAEVTLKGGKLYWLESRPAEKGRVALMSWHVSRGIREELSKEFSVRSRVHEYGGGALLVTDAALYFINDFDRQVYEYKDGKTRKITDEQGACYADGACHPTQEVLFYVREKGGENTIVRIEPSQGLITTIAAGRDFYSSPRVSFDGRVLCYLAWDHPNMPWDAAELWWFDLDTAGSRLIAGGKHESVVNPQWSRQGILYYVSDRTNWWNLYRYPQKEPLLAMEAEFAFPAWVFGRALFGFYKDGIACSFVKNGESFFSVISAEGVIQQRDMSFTKIEAVVVEGSQVALIASSPQQPSSIVLYDLDLQKIEIIKSCRPALENCDYVSIPQAIEFPTTQGRTAHAFYYPPANPFFTTLPGEKPPLLVQSHGGPTANFAPGFNSRILFWTSRGFAVVAVNYGGSTGYGRAYRDRLKGNWGIVDVDDCVNAAKFCVKQGLADESRLTIEGGSAGGFTTLAALAGTDLFCAGADYYGVSDLERLALDTHKFEAHYLDQLVGPYPKERSLYLDRSPIYKIASIKSPVIILQGDEDAVVPPAQSATVFNGLKNRGIPTAYLLFKGEQHGFRRSENIRRALEAQLYFFAKILGFALSETAEPVTIENLPNKE